MALRRTALLALPALLLPKGALWAAPKTGKTLRVGYLSPGSSDLRLLKPELAKLGYVEGKNVVYEARTGPAEEADRLAQELVATRSDVIVGVINNYVRALQSATRNIPIVMMWVADPVRGGLVKSLARPGGNITGAITLQELTWSKLAEIARNFVPAAPAIGFLASPLANPLHDIVASLVRDAVGSWGGNVVVHKARDQADLDAVFAAAARSGIRVMLVAPGPPFINYRREMSLAGRKHGVGWAGTQARYAQDGALFGYGMDTASHYRDVAAFVDRIVNGADPATLPVEQPTLFEFAINARVAKELGLAIPSALRISADIVQ